MRGPVLVVHPGSDVSTGDVYQGLIPALKRLGGRPIIEYPLNAMLPLSAQWLAFLRRRRVTRDAPLLLWGAVTLEGGSPPEPTEEADGRTKQEQHPSRTVRGLPPLVEARDGAAGAGQEQGEAAGE